MKYNESPSLLPNRGAGLARPVYVAVYLVYGSQVRLHGQGSGVSSRRSVQQHAQALKASGIACCLASSWMSHAAACRAGGMLHSHAAAFHLVTAVLRVMESMKPYLTTLFLVARRGKAGISSHECKQHGSLLSLG